MVNYITVSGDWNFYLFLFLSNAVKLYAGTVFITFSVYVIYQKIALNNTKFRSLYILVFTPFLVLFALNVLGNRVQVGADKWMKLAQAESTLLQLQTTNDLEKKPLSFDRQKADEWIKDMRNQTSKGSMSYNQFYELANDYNNLNVGLDDIKNWFKSNSTDSIRKELENNMQQMLQRNNGMGQPPQAQQQAEQLSAEDQAALEMENKLTAALQ